MARLVIGSIAKSSFQGYVILVTARMRNQGGPPGFGFTVSFLR
jgi:hypothetical protein